MTRIIEVALIRQGLRTEDRSLRAVGEGTGRSLTWHLRKDKLPVRGQASALMDFGAAAVMANLHHIHAYLSKGAA